MSWTSYKNTIHIFKHTVVFLFVYFKKAANFECWDLNETLMAYQQVISAPLSFEDTSQERGLAFCLQVKKIRKWTRLHLLGKESPFLTQMDLSQLLWSMHEMSVWEKI